ncbi:hypothetical protein D3C72_2027410 [compost metagenome]
MGADAQPDMGAMVAVAVYWVLTPKVIRELVLWGDGSGDPVSAVPGLASPFNH